MHWAVHGQTAAELIFKRANANKPYLGLTNFKGEKPTKKEAGIAKNYLNDKELDVLNRMVSAYLEIAELQALNRKPMYMKDWIDRLDDFVKMTGNDILTHAGKVSHQQALEKAHEEYQRYQEQIRNELSRAEKDFLKHLDQSAKQLKDKNRETNH